MSWLTENICSLLTDFMGGFIDAYGSLINNIFFLFVQIASTNEYYINAQRLFVLLGFALVALVSVKIVSAGYFLETAYDSEEDPFNLLIRITQATAVISSSGWIFSYGLQFSRDLCDDLLNSTDVTGYSGKTQSLLQTTMTGSRTDSAFIVMLAVIFIAFIIFCVMSGLRAGELMAMNLFLPIFAVDLLTNSRERWSNFIMGYGFAFISYAIQTLFFMISLKSYISAEYTNPSYMLSALVWMIVAIKAPQVIEKYLYKTGVSTAASSGLRMVAQSIAMRQMVH